MYNYQVIDPNKYRKSDRRGFILPAVLIMLGLMAFYVGALFSLVSADTALQADRRDYEEALFAAETGANWMAEVLWVGFSKSVDPAERLAWLDEHWQSYNQTQARQCPGFDDESSLNHAFVARVAQFTVGPGVLDRTIVIESEGRVKESGVINNADSYERRSITRVVRYGFGQAQVFDFSYFINNFGWFWGSTIYCYGDMGANANVSLQSNPTIDGDIFAAKNAVAQALGNVDGTSRLDTASQYTTVTNNNPKRVRAADTNTNKYFDGKYHYRTTKFAQSEQLPMPYLKDIANYESLAHTKHGTIRQGGALVVNEVFNGKLYLNGTAANPIVIDGPVVIKGDLAIRGVVRGNGTIYTERNTHIVGDLSYETLPDPANNVPGDMLGLAARGSILLGDYTASTWSSVLQYIKPTFTKPYIDEDGSTFNGDYTANDGGKKEDNTNRKYYESSWSNTNFHNFFKKADNTYENGTITRVDAVSYTNHAFAGRPSNCKFFGSIISRDEGLLYDGSINMFQDPRSYQKAQQYRDIQLPKTASVTQVAWAEGEFDSPEVQQMLSRAVQCSQ